MASPSSVNAHFGNTPPVGGFLRSMLYMCKVCVVSTHSHTYSLACMLYKCAGFACCVCGKNVLGAGLSISKCTIESILYRAIM